MRKNNELDLTTGSIFKELIAFALPVLAVNVLQLLFNTADTVVLGRFAAQERATVAVGAVGATTPLINLLIGFFVGISLGANVVVARCKGMGNAEKAKKAVGSSVMISLCAGILLLVIGFFGARTFLSWMQCEGELLDFATDYLKIYFLGMPVIMFYNFAASILRAVGDTLRPLIFLVVGGALNLGLNVFFVVVVGLDVEGVAIATVASNAISAVCCLAVMLKSNGFSRLEFKHLRFFKNETREILYVGVPSGLQKIFFSISNVFIQSMINSYGTLAVSGSTVAHNIDGYIHEAGEAFAISTLSFTSQNIGAGKLSRIVETMKKAVLIITVNGLVLGGLAILFSEPLCMFIRNDAEIVPYAQQRLYVLCSSYFICNIMGVFAYTMRGMGKSVTSMVISLFGGCVLRIVMVYFAELLFPRNMTALFMAYPLSWIATIAVQIFIVRKIYRDLVLKAKKIERERAERAAAKSAAMEKTA